MSFPLTPLHRRGKRRSPPAARLGLVPHSAGRVAVQRELHRVWTGGVGRATDSRHYADAASSADAWFEGLKASGQPVYDRERGAVYDGIDNGWLSRTSSAEANIEGGLAMVERTDLNDVIRH